MRPARLFSSLAAASVLLTACLATSACAEPRVVLISRDGATVQGRSPHLCSDGRHRDHDRDDDKPRHGDRDDD